MLMMVVTIFVGSGPELPVDRDRKREREGRECGRGTLPGEGGKHYQESRKRKDPVTARDSERRDQVEHARLQRARDGEMYFLPQYFQLKLFIW